MAAGKQRIDGDPGAFGNAGDVVGFQGTGKLMTHDQRGLGPGMESRVNVKIGAADARVGHLHQGVALLDLGHGDVLDRQLVGTFINDCLHIVSPPKVGFGKTPHAGSPSCGAFPAYFLGVLTG